MKYSRRKIMLAAWKIFRKVSGISFAAALRLAWANIKLQTHAKEAAGITETTHTWAGWKAAGYEVIHESVALFKVKVFDPCTKSGTRILSYFGASQVRPLEA